MLTIACELLAIICLAAFALIVWPPLLLIVGAGVALALSYAEPWTAWKRGDRP